MTKRRQSPSFDAGTAHAGLPPCCALGAQRLGINRTKTMLPQLLLQNAGECPAASALRSAGSACTPSRRESPSISAQLSRCRRRFGPALETTRMRSATGLTPTPNTALLSNARGAGGPVQGLVLLCHKRKLKFTRSQWGGVSPVRWTTLGNASPICRCPLSNCHSIRCNRQYRRRLDSCTGVFDAVKFHTKRHIALLGRTM